MSPGQRRHPGNEDRFAKPLLDGLRHEDERVDPRRARGAGMKRSNTSCAGVMTRRWMCGGVPSY